MSRKLEGSESVRWSRSGFWIAPQGGEFRVDDEFGDGEVGEHGNPCDVGVDGFEFETGHLPEAEFDAEHDGGEGEGVVADHPRAVRDEIAAEDGGERAPAGIEPEHGEHTETELRDEAAESDRAHIKTAEAADENADKIEATGDAMRARPVSADGGDELRGADHERGDGGDAMRPDDREVGHVFFAEVRVEDIAVGSDVLNRPRTGEQRAIGEEEERGGFEFLEVHGDYFGKLCVRLPVRYTSPSLKEPFVGS